MKNVLCVLAVMALPMIANGDTLTLTNNSALNGSVRYENGIFYVEAKYPKRKTIHYLIPRDEVTSDEINDETYNQGAPPPGVTAYQVARAEWISASRRIDLIKSANVQPERRRGRSSQDIPGSSKSPETNASNAREQTTDPQPGRDTLTLTSNQNQTGKLKLMTSETILFRGHGQRSDTLYQRDQVKLVTVKKSG